VTTQNVPVFVDVERLLVIWLSGRLGRRVLTDLPGDLAGQVPLVQIARYGGADERPGLDTVLLDVDAYGANRGSAVALAEAARHALRFALPGEQLDRAVVTRVDTLEAPSLRPYDNTDVRRFGATYRLILHLVG
jgi:hypothetical protein